MRTAPSEDRLTLLRRLYDEELQRGHEGTQWYLEAQSLPHAMLRHLGAFERCLPHMPREGKILDWGCLHAPDACLLRNELGAAVELHGCDFLPPGEYPVFHEYAGLHYRQLDSPFVLPYEDGQFDAVVASGVLEHTANDSRSLDELHRVLKEGGVLVLTFLPNRWSYTELLGHALAAVTRGRMTLATHLRRYGRRDARRRLLHHGFLPVLTGYHQMLPSHRLRGRLFARLWALNGVLERIWPANRLSSNVFLVSTRRSTM